MVATRFYLSATTAAAVSPAFQSWVRTTEGDRREMSPTKDGSSLTDKTLWANTTPGSLDTALCRQFVSAPMGAGVAFTSGDYVKGVIRCKESAANDEIERMLLYVRVFSEDGTTQRAFTPSALLSPANEFATTLTNRMFNGSLNASYTTVANDRLVFEVGGRVKSAGATSVTGTMNFGSSAGADLAENETGTTASDPWIEIDRECFPVAGGQPTAKRWGGVTFAGGRAPAKGIQQWTKRLSGLAIPAYHMEAVNG